MDPFHGNDQPLVENNTIFELSMLELCRVSSFITLHDVAAATDKTLHYRHRVLMDNV